MFVTRNRNAIIVLLATLGMAVSAQAAAPELSRLGADRWHAKGFGGGGMTVAVLDSSFLGYRSQLGRALPANVRMKSFRFDGNLESKNSAHGTLCAEVLHAVAPDADLIFANWEPDHPESFLQAVKWARDQGAKVFCCSIVIPGWSDGNGGGDVHRELATLLEGSLFFASAGNLAQRHWTGLFHDNGARRHEWTPGRTENEVLSWGSQPISVELTSPAGSYYQLTVRDAQGHAAAPARPLLSCGAKGSAVRFIPEPGARYKVTVELAEGKSSGFRLLALGGDLEITTPGGCMVFPGDGAEVIAVGGVTEEGQRLASSSTGVAGRRLKPECVAPVPFPSHCRSTPFGGTSAAAPQAAGAAALLWSRQPNAPAERIREILQKNCVDVGPPGRDYQTGHGQVKLPPP